MKKRWMMLVGAMVLTLVLPMVMMAQSRATIMSMAQDELQRRGLTLPEVRARLIENGIDVDNLPPSEYPNYEGRVMEILNQMQAEKAAAQTNPAAAATGGVNVVTTAEDTPQTTTGEAAAEAALEDALVVNEVSPTAGDDIYGHSLFTGTSMDVFRTTDGAQAPDTYVLGEGDEVHISIFGSSQTEIHQRIDADGSIQPAGASKIFLKGLTMAQARAAIRTRLASHYSFREDQIAVTITTARTVMVSIYGEVGVQGGFTLSALNSAFNALAAAGGPSAIGSVRNVQLSRGGKNSRLDLYAYMTRSNPAFNYELQNGDVLFVPVAQKVVTIEGAVNRPMRYEMIEGEGVKELVEYAGGLLFNAFMENVQVERFENGERKYLEFNLGDVMRGTKIADLHNGDIVHIYRTDRPIQNYVGIRGDVYYEGNYDAQQNSSLKGLIEKAKPRITTKTDYVFVERMAPDSTITVLSVPFPGVNGNPDFKLQPRDIVRVLQQSDFADVANITVSGEVRQPFTRAFRVNDRMTVSQAIELAGGVRPSTFPVAYLVRRDITDNTKVQYKRVSLDADGGTLLQPGDSLNVYDNSLYSNVGEVRISGAVKQPFGTTFDESLTLHDMIEMAGGFSVGAAYDRIEVFRTHVSLKDTPTTEKITLEVDKNYNLVGSNFRLQPYDHVVVRMVPDFHTGRTVEVNGRVKYPGVYVLDDNRTQLWDIIQLAGGLLDDADPFVRLFRTYNGRGNIAVNLKQAKTHKGKDASDPILMDGDVININRQENTVFIRETGTRIGQYAPDEFTPEQTAVIYQGPKSAKWYIKHYAGGFQRFADKKSVTVTMPSGQVESVKKGLFGIRIYPTVEPGSVISMRMDEEKIRDYNREMEQPKQKFDVQDFLTRTVSVITSLASIIILASKL